MTGHYDIFVIGGGINGCGIARDAAGRGYSVGLAEMKDLASGTSSWSTNRLYRIPPFSGLRWWLCSARHALIISYFFPTFTGNCMK